MSLDTYTVKLPSNLPPTYRGRTLRFSYQLSIGACRATVDAGVPSSQSRVMKVPIRIYNHVSGKVPSQFHSTELTECRPAASKPPRWYDLLTGSAEYGGRLEGKIEEGPRDIPKCTHLELSPAFILPIFRKHHYDPRHHRGLLIRALSAI